MKLSGKVIAKEIKDYGKGKGADANEVGVITVKLDGAFRGKLTCEPPAEEFSEIDLGDKCAVSLEFSQQKLNLNRRAAAKAH